MRESKRCRRPVRCSGREGRSITAACACVAVWLGLLSVALSAGPAEVFVSPQGNDAGAGTEDKPFGTVDRARKRVRELRKGGAKGEIHVVLRGGRYELKSPIVFEAEDSGTEDGPTVYAAHPGERPVITGGRRLQPGGTDDAGRLRFLLPEGMADVAVEQLYVNGRRAIPARTPNSLYYYAQRPVPGVGDLRKRVPPDSPGRLGFVAFPKDLTPLHGLSKEALHKVTVVVYNSWEVSRHHIESADMADGCLTFTGPYFVNFFHFGRPRYYFISCPGALDAPGEWQQVDNKTIVYVPRPGEEAGTVEAVVPVIPHLVELRGKPGGPTVQHVTMRGLHFQHTAYVLPPEGESSNQAASKIPAAVMVDYASGIVFEDCHVAHTGGYGIWFRNGCRESAARRCLLGDLGAGGVRVGICELAHAKEPEHATSHIVVDNCIIRNGGNIWAGAVGVFVAHSGDNRITHNDISAFRYTGISAGWRWGYGDVPSKRNTISFNHIHHIGDILADMGGIYTLGEAPGTVLQRNVIHDIDGHGRSQMVGIYNDNSTSDLLIEENVVYNVRDGGYTLGSGRANLVRNNIFLSGRCGLLLFCLYYPERDKHVAATLEQNILYGMPDPEGGGPRSNPFNGRDPGAFIQFERNLYFDPTGRPIKLRGKSFAEWQAAGYDKGSIVADPRFRDVQRHDFRLAPDSPALALGFKPFDWTKAGVYGDPSWIAAAKDYTYATPRTKTPDPPPLTVRDDFETTDVGKAPDNGARVHVEGKGDAIAVSKDAPASGQHCLKVTDAAGLKHSFNPHFYYRPDHRRGTTVVSFDLRLGPGAELQHEWRQYPGRPHFYAGPSLRIKDGAVTVGKRTLTTLPENAWIHMEVRAALGDASNGTWDLAIRLPGQPEQTFDDLPLRAPQAKRATWIGFISSGAAPAEWYLDNIVIRSER